MAVLCIASLFFLLCLPKVVDSQAAGTDCSSLACSTGLTCENSICKIIAGGDCSIPNLTNCRAETVCESNVCKIIAGGDCSIPNDANCRAETVCEFNVCKIIAGGDCSIPNLTNCRAYTVCESNVCTADNTYGGPCSISGTVDSCINTGGDANAVCINSKCACKTGYSGSVGAKCSADNTYGGSCSITGTVDSCVTNGGDANAVCTNSKCACKTGYTGSVGAKCSGGMALTSSVFLVLAALLVKTHLE